MFIKLASALFALVAAFAGCATTGPVVTRVQGVVDCSAKSVVEQLPAVVTEVVTDLLSKDYVRLLSNVGQRVGDAVLVCAVKTAADGAADRMAATDGAQPNQEAIKAHAADYLRLRDVNFSEPITRTSAAALPICRPACDSCHVCFQLQSPPGGPLFPPTCIPRSPKPIRCP